MGSYLVALRSCGVLKGRVWEHVGAAGVSLAPESGARRGVVSWPPPYGACESAVCRTVARGARYRAREPLRGGVPTDSKRFGSRPLASAAAPPALARVQVFTQTVSEAKGTRGSGGGGCGKRSGQAKALKVRMLPRCFLVSGLVYIVGLAVSVSTANAKCAMKKNGLQTRTEDQVSIVDTFSALDFGRLSAHAFALRVLGLGSTGMGLFAQCYG